MKTFLSSTLVTLLFICSVYGGMSTIGISLVGIAVAYFYDMIGSKPQETTSSSDVEEDLDL
ncbi:PTS system mannose/fructose/N-acetylgalactosamine-specific transporter subunit IIC [Streptococcus pneumoniae]|nr:PTS system mannose/fructose/N-acetylgalactosamine-specific transporter subunit IIC [Streptococcus pneumoniae]